MVHSGDRRHVGVRRRLASDHLSGSGIEIGALFLPLSVPRTASVRYVDRFPVPVLREHYPELHDVDFVTPDVLDDGERLATFADGSLDFVIANHFIEHCGDPIGTLENQLRVLRKGGVLYMAVPDCRLTFDRDRPITSVEHLQKDHSDGPAGSRRQHFEEWASHVDHAQGSDVFARADELESQDYSIHFHVWTPTAFVEFLTYCRSQCAMPFEIDAVERNDHEFIVILRRA